MKKPAPKRQPIAITPERIAELRMRYQPVGSGPLHVMRVVFELCEDIAADKGWDLDEVFFTKEYDETETKTVRVKERYKGLSLVSREKIG